MAALIRDVLVRLQPRVDIAAEAIPHVASCILREQVDAQVSRPDRVRLRGHQVTPVLESRGRAGESEREQQAEQGKHGAFRRGKAFRQAVRVVVQPGQTKATADFGGRQECERAAPRSAARP